MANADLAASAAEFAYSATGHSCGLVNEVAARQAIRRARACEATNALGNVAELGTKLSGSVEDDLFGLLASREADELGCGANFAGHVAAGGAATAEVTKLVRRLRKFRQDGLDALRRLRAPSRAPKQMCPKTIGELDSSAYANAEFNGLCTSIIKARAGFDMTRAMIPLGNEPHVARMLTTLADRASEPNDADVSQQIKATYAEAEMALARDSKTLKARRLNGAGLNPSERHELLRDAAVVDAVVGTSPDLKNVACSANARFGEGADLRDAGLSIGALLLPPVAEGVALAGRVGSGLVRAAFLAKTAGRVSIGVARMLSVGAASFAGGAVLSEIEKHCRPSGWSLNARGAGGCHSAPTIEKLSYNNCALTIAIEGLGASAGPLHLAAMAVPAARATSLAKKLNLSETLSRDHLTKVMDQLLEESHLAHQAGDVNSASHFEKLWEDLASACGETGAVAGKCAELAKLAAESSPFTPSHALSNVGRAPKMANAAEASTSKVPIILSNSARKDLEHLSNLPQVQQKYQKFLDVIQDPEQGLKSIIAGQNSWRYEKLFENGFSSVRLDRAYRVVFTVGKDGEITIHCVGKMCYDH